MFAVATKSFAVVMDSNVLLETVSDELFAINAVEAVNVLNEQFKIVTEPVVEMTVPDFTLSNVLLENFTDELVEMNAEEASNGLKEQFRIVTEPVAEMALVEFTLSKMQLESSASPFEANMVPVFTV